MGLIDQLKTATSKVDVRALLAAGDSFKDASEITRAKWRRIATARLPGLPDEAPKPKRAPRKRKPAPVCGIEGCEVHETTAPKKARAPRKPRVKKEQRNEVRDLSTTERIAV